MAEDGTRKRLLAIDVLLEEPDEISDGLEAELYALRDRLESRPHTQAGLLVERTRSPAMCAEPRCCGSRRPHDT